MYLFIFFFFFSLSLCGNVRLIELADQIIFDLKALEALIWIFFLNPLPVSKLLRYCSSKLYEIQKCHPFVQQHNFTNCSSYPFWLPPLFISWNYPKPFIFIRWPHSFVTFLNTICESIYFRSPYVHFDSLYPSPTKRFLFEVRL